MTVAEKKSVIHGAPFAFIAWFGIANHKIWLNTMRQREIVGRWSFKKTNYYKLLQQRTNVYCPWAIVVFVLDIFQIILHNERRLYVQKSGVVTVLEN